MLTDAHSSSCLSRSHGYGTVRKVRILLVVPCSGGELIRGALEIALKHRLET